jgi:type I restriction enzyme R subunit
MPAPGEHKTVQARILKYAQEIGWKYVPCEEVARRRRFLPHPNPLPEDGAREMMEHQLMTAQIRVHDLDLEEILQQSAAEFGGGTFQALR